jgi:hypothetical protein
VDIISSISNTYLDSNLFKWNIPKNEEYRCIELKWLFLTYTEESKWTNILKYLPNIKIIN